MWNHVIQRAVASSNRRTTIRFADLKQRRYWLPLMVFQKSIFLMELSCITN